MKKYHAYQIFDAEGGALMGVDENPGELWARFADALNLAGECGGVETVEVGVVYGKVVEDALNKIRSEEWDKNLYYGCADGVGYQPDEADEPEEEECPKCGETLSPRQAKTCDNCGYGPDLEYNN